MTHKRHAAMVGGGLIGLVLLSGCVSATYLHPAPPATTAQARAAAREYVIGGNDVLVVTFIYNPDYDQTLTVQPDGRIKLPMIGAVMASGQTPDGLAAQLSREYIAYLKHPYITVTVQSTGPQLASGAP